MPSKLRAGRTSSVFVLFRIEAGFPYPGQVRHLSLPTCSYRTSPARPASAGPWPADCDSPPRRHLPGPAGPGAPRGGALGFTAAGRPAAPGRRAPRRISRRPLPAGFRSVVVITFASHAKGPRFETGRKQPSFFFFFFIQTPTPVGSPAEESAEPAGTLPAPGSRRRVGRWLGPARVSRHRRSPSARSAAGSFSGRERESVLGCSVSEAPRFLCGPPMSRLCFGLCSVPPPPAGAAAVAPPADNLPKLCGDPASAWRRSGSRVPGSRSRAPSPTCLHWALSPMSAAPTPPVLSRRQRSPPTHFSAPPHGDPKALGSQPGENETFSSH